jgi:sulfite exporter TauE/SafE
VTSAMIGAMVSALLLGLAGGFSHCIAMCHPFTLLISANFPQVGYKILIPQLKYNLGRSLTYAVLGFALGQVNLLPYKQALGLVTGVLLLIAVALMASPRLSSAISRYIQLPSIADRLNISSIRSPFVLGLVLGLLPCGLVLSALVLSATGGSAAASALSMLLFGMGTSVALLLVAVFGGVLLRYAPVARWLFIVVILYKAVTLIYNALP